MTASILAALVLGLATAAAPDPLAELRPAVLAELEAAGASFGAMALGLPAASSGSDYAKSPRWRSLVAVLRKDLAAQRRRDKRAGVGMAFAHRTFDGGWLTSGQTRLELIGVVRRPDRRVFAPAHCGEVRHVYRLAYSAETRGRPVTSRLPMTVNVVHFATCPAVGGRLEAGALRSVEVNLQSVRWPSTVHPTMAGHAEYLLRVFHPSGGGRELAPARLENTPDVPRIQRDKRLKAELLAWLAEPTNLAAVDAGTAVLPDRFLARRAVSVAPRGMGRLANRPWTQLFGDRELAPLPLASTKRVQSSAALLRRLDQLSCQGCHQTRSLAGFHLLGLDRGGGVDALAVAGSAHFFDDLARRRAHRASLAQGRRPDEERGFADRPGLVSEPGSFGAACGLDPAGPFAAWTCAAGLSCRAVGEADVGACFQGGGHVGEPCEMGTVSQHRDPHADRVRDVRRSSCGAGVCESNRVGFPGGMCATSCADPDPSVACGVIPALQTFSRCLAERWPFAECVARTGRPAGLRSCDEQHPCRDDYVCARVPGGGACLPPYFLFQLRVDGHPRVSP